jgi:hypothetical protein
LLSIQEIESALYPCFIGQLRRASDGARWVAVTLPDGVLPGDPMFRHAAVLRAWVEQVIDGGDWGQEVFLCRPEVAVGDTPEEAMRNLYAKGLWRHG